MKKLLIPLYLIFFFVSEALALDPNRPGIFVRVIDVGAGLSCVVKYNDPDNASKYMIYDTGNSRNKVGSGPNGQYGVVAFREIKQLIPENSDIGWVIISHEDSDHLGCTKQICERYRVKNFLRTGWERNVTPNNPLYAWNQQKPAIDKEVETDGAKEWNQSVPEKQMQIGNQFNLGEAKLTLLSGFGNPPADWGNLSRSKKRNAISIVLRLDYAGKSILFTGDAVGAKDHEDGEEPIATEKFLIENLEDRPINTDVLIAAHHGANNACSQDFLREVSPRFVVFSAGTSHKHPRWKTVERVKQTESVQYIFRTDLGDKPRQGEWMWGTSQEGDRAGDDHVDIAISPSGRVLVFYEDYYKRSYAVHQD